MAAGLTTLPAGPTLMSNPEAGGIGADAASPRRRRRRLRVELVGWMLGTAGTAGALAWLAAVSGWSVWWALPATVLVTGLASAAWLERRLGPIGSLFRALEGTVASYRDGDFAFSIAWPHDDELRPLVEAHNQLGQALRDQRLQLVQRELLLDTMVQQTPVAMLLADAGGRVVFANLAARHLLGRGRRLEGLSLQALQPDLPAALADVLASAAASTGVPGAAPGADGGQGLVSVPGPAAGAAGPDGDATDREAETYLVSQQRLMLAGQPHRLVLLRRLTQELRRQEVQSWKKLIRVISHELNNSLAPIASLAYSGGELARRGRTAELPDLLATIEERARHLDAFIRGYAQFAQLPSPRLAPVRWPVLLQRLQAQQRFQMSPAAVARDAPPDQGDADLAWVDAAQIEQALINLLRNAHESGSPPGDVAVRWDRVLADGVPHWRVEVLDRGTGMSDEVMAQALTPFYSTKRQGTGLGLALAREIAEAHGGRLTLQRRDGGGLCVSLRLPMRTGPALPWPAAGPAAGMAAGLAAGVAADDGTGPANGGESGGESNAGTGDETGDRAGNQARAATGVRAGDAAGDEAGVPPAP